MLPGHSTAACRGVSFESCFTRPLAHFSSSSDQTLHQHLTHCCLPPPWISRLPNTSASLLSLLIAPLLIVIFPGAFLFDLLTLGCPKQCSIFGPHLLSVVMLLMVSSNHKASNDMDNIHSFLHQCLRTTPALSAPHLGVQLTYSLLYMTEKQHKLNKLQSCLFTLSPCLLLHLIPMSDSSISILNLAPSPNLVSQMWL